MTHTPDPAATVATAPLDIREVVATAVFHASEEHRSRGDGRTDYDFAIADAAISAIAGLAGDEVAEMLKIHAKAYGDYHRARDRWFDNGRYSEGVPLLDGLKAELDAYETTLKALIASIQACVPVVTGEIVDQLVAEFTTAANPNWIIGNYGTVSTLLRRFLELTMEGKNANR